METFPDTLFGGFFYVNTYLARLLSSGSFFQMIFCLGTLPGYFFSGELILETFSDTLFRGFFYVNTYLARLLSSGNFF